MSDGTIGRLVSAAVTSMATGMVIIEAPSGRIAFRNAEADRLFGSALAAAVRFQDLDGQLAYHASGVRLAPDRWPILRALEGELLVNQQVEIERRDGERRILAITSSPIHDENHQLVAAVSTFCDLTQMQDKLGLTREHKDELEEAIERASVADRRKNEFLAMLSHELRNPLAPITTALDLMHIRGVTEGAKERDVIRRQVVHLSRLIDDLLDVSRITGGQIQLSRSVLELSAVVSRAVETVSPLLERHAHRLRIDVPSAGLLVDADAVRLAQVFQNLLVNAVKFSEPRTVIDLDAFARGDEVVVQVRDCGIGMSADFLPRVFDLFVQGERSLDRSEGGLGIGLAIARSLCELHGGRITASSAGAGKGSTFEVALPRAAASQTAAALESPVSLARALEQTGRRMRVLVVDDNVDAALMLNDFLAALGHETIVAYDGPVALELVSSFQPDVAVLDIGLPVMDGYELARRLRESLGPDKLRLIALTGYGQDADRAKATEVGFDHHLVKPVDLDALLPLLAK
jgi:signal transduction histidine kinase